MHILIKVLKKEERKERKTMSKFLITAAIKAKAEEMTLRKGEGMIS